jgi:hypothetical protein
MVMRLGNWNRDGSDYKKKKSAYMETRRDRVGEELRRAKEPLCMRDLARRYCVSLTTIRKDAVALGLLGKLSQSVKG